MAEQLLSFPINARYTTTVDSREATAGELLVEFVSVVEAVRCAVEIQHATCFQKAVEITRRQRAKSLELLAVMSLSRLWSSRSYGVLFSEDTITLRESPLENIVLGCPL